MSDEQVILTCSPTLAGMKTGSMFSQEFTSKEELNETLRRLNLRFTNKGLRFLFLKYENNRALIYVYRPKQLEKDLEDELSKRLLADLGYPNMHANRCIVNLICRMHEQADFPHEIGLFLSYPPKDVAGFIENRACDCKCVGNWKVYDDVESAKKTFAKYKKCKDIYCSMWSKGKTMEQLTVAS